MSDDYESAQWYISGTRQDAEVRLFLNFFFFFTIKITHSSSHQVELAGDDVLPGRFVVRPSSQSKCLGLTIKEEDNAFTHSLLRLTDDGWSCTVEVRE
jgi:hypothetical protein